MCQCASFVLTKTDCFWLPLSDSHEEIIKEFKLHEGAGRVNFCRVEISPEGNNLSLPLAEWKYKVDQPETPDWYDAEDAEKRTRAELKKWAKSKLTGWNVKEAFSPVHPFKLEPKPLSCEKALALLKEWVSVRASVGDSVWDSVWASVGASVGAYCGGLFVPKIKKWKHAEKLGANPWKPVTELWYMGYVPSFDGKVWRLHCNPKAGVKYKFTAEEVKKGRK